MFLAWRMALVRDLTPSSGPGTGNVNFISVSWPCRCASCTQLFGRFMHARGLRVVCGPVGRRERYVRLASPRRHGKDASLAIALLFLRDARFFARALRRAYRGKS